VVCVFHTWYFHSHFLCIHLSHKPLAILIEWATGYALNITAVVLWFLAGMSCYIFPAPVVHAERPEQEQTVSYQQNFDGTVTETNVVIQGKPVNAVGQPESAEKEMDA
jgi:hypothetical protein